MELEIYNEDYPNMAFIISRRTPRCKYNLLVRGFLGGTLYKGKFETKDDLIIFIERKYKSEYVINIIKEELNF